ncbi:MAG: tyrosine-type recombinase/integrase [Rhizobiaceae bacterium]|nr:tyrosine-type recombinase/integrase [Rhizobiaceae bacterium]
MVLPMSRPLKHPKTGVYYLRERVPADLVALVGRREIWKSLRTKEPAMAKGLHAEEKRKLDLRWKSLRAKPEALPHQQLVALSGKLYRRVMEMHEVEPGEPGIWQQTLRIVGELDGRADAMEQWYGESADAILAEEGLATDNHSRARLIQEAHRAFRQAADQQLKRSQGDYRPDPDADRFPDVSKPDEGKKSGAISIIDLFELWERDHLADGKSARTPRDHRQKLDDLVAFLGHDDAKGVTPKNVSDWTEHLRHERKLAAKTVADKYLSAVRAVFGAGVAKFRIDHNPAAPVSIRVPKRKIERPKGFTDDEAKQILNAALEAPEAPGNTSLENRRAYRWVPWICAYTGARCGEITQLRKDDFVKEAGVSCIRITPEAGSVKTGQFRIVPLHPHLVEQGLLKLVADAKEGPLFYKPSGRKRKDGVTQASYVVGKVSKWVRDVAKITDRRVQPNHGWRHRFKTQARDAGIEQRYMDAIQGHEDGSASVQYGENTMKALSREIRKLSRYSLTDSVARQR